MGRDWFRATCRYDGIVHSRTILFVKPGAVFIEDALQGPSGEHLVEQFWHLGEEATMVSTASL